MSETMNTESVLSQTNGEKPAFKNRKPRFFVTKAGLVGVRGITGTKPLVMYKDQWETLYRLFESGHLENFMDKNTADIKIRTFKKKEGSEEGVASSPEAEQTAVEEPSA